MARVLTQKVLHKFLHPDFPEAENVVTSKWKSDPFTRGAYSFISNTSSVRDIENLSQPIFSDAANTKKVNTGLLQNAHANCSLIASFALQPVLLFAGEACHPSYFATTHGAFLSGKTAASYLVDDHVPGLIQTE